MFSHITDWELSIVCIVIAIFTVKPISLFPDAPQHPNRNMLQESQASHLIHANISAHRAAGNVGFLG